MKRIAAIGLISIAITACRGLDAGNPAEGSLSLSFNGASVARAVEELSGTRGVPVEKISLDTNSFILSIKNNAGETVYYGAYGNRPASIEVEEDLYEIKVGSIAFEAPAFDSPLFGDSQMVQVERGKSVAVSLKCTRRNAGVSITFTDGYLERYGSSPLLLEHESGSLEYSASETRIAYFPPGDIDFVSQSGSTRKLLFSRTLSAGKMLCLELSASDDISAVSSSFSISVDTSAEWISEQVKVGENGTVADGLSKTTAFSVAAVRHNVGQKIWVHGYIVAGDLSTSAISFTKPFSSRTHFAIADKASEQVRGNCVAVELPSKIRDALNLVDNPSLLGHEVWVYGTVAESYFGLYGIKSTSEYSL